ncbi:MAG: hypothetical protein A2836_01805 [Candidatus Taylorbacteria bacterium RIFCSPHIGHO2_01_FULL_45_63]|uniref:UPF0102 protein A3D56_03710 n=1 Tax=Candidatus Taylorbacteria bacterium RIFCSPHIGHO2_02_FULL_45_35 TaxID=1802311 RepID=A0A1G2MR62_9BACT|nr:MAG: hypothetical protein A2836_01805 [Candidatus Taylorbacteria bacterium RIFCSPHIGHO2_01_FULL_45_63]OHA26355.1 MAG: hypothetical protein A3D56_03710 [Candidatus Taylorbacteria bacterium RIFCSPHIGHO2_02_FULL_45_35]OHA32799.1 MAG: hypothetical protein A3A22_02565 [Candidatus Taylorbacteria bacterium RIFCSPLOWO2_01_FULL_45_34b]
MENQKKHIGRLGEDIATRYLKEKGFEILDRNYLKRVGEIDIVAKKDKKIHFVEVKTVSREINQKVTHETSNYRPEDNVHIQKTKRLARTIQIYLEEKHVSHETGWEFDVVAITLSVKDKVAKVSFLKDIIL